jgi:lipoate synthase
MMGIRDDYEGDSGCPICGCEKTYRSEHASPCDECWEKERAQWLICPDCNGEGCRYCRRLGEVRENEDELRELEEWDKALYQLDIKEGL